MRRNVPLIDMLSSVGLIPPSCPFSNAATAGLHHGAASDPFAVAICNMKVKIIRALLDSAIIRNQTYHCMKPFLCFARWHGVASWTWTLDSNDDACGICRMAFDGCCPDCKMPGDDCPLIWGACNHAFHLHCILKWVNSQSPRPHCPMCRREWKFGGS